MFSRSQDRRLKLQFDFEEVKLVIAARTNLSESVLISKGADATIGTFENAVRFARKSDYWEEIIARWTDK